MAIAFTKEQQQVIDLRHRNLLVSAAAGSGKTAVLVERILHLITEEGGCDIDELLIVTFTRAAAAEMRERIAQAIGKRLKETPQDENLQRQQSLLYHAQITTIDSFCKMVVENYFHEIEVEPDFRLLDEDEGKLMQEDVLDQVLTAYYQEETPEFVSLLESVAGGKTDQELKDLVFRLNAFANSHPWPQEWLRSCVAAYEFNRPEDFPDSQMGQKLMGFLQTTAQEMRLYYEEILRLCQEPGGPLHYLDKCFGEYEGILALSQCQDLFAWEECLGKIEFARLPGKSKTPVDEEIKECVKALRNKVKDVAQKQKDIFFFKPLEEMISGLSKNKNLVETLVQLTCDFQDAFSQKKREKNRVDFNDLEHFALELLVDGETGEVTPVAKQLQQRFREVMVDEYQDSNLVQETILSAVAGRAARFMVGDVKQSIYAFRMARPDLFMEKYHDYTLEESSNQKIILGKNFRSRKEVIETVNDVFSVIMDQDIGNVAYDEEAALYQGMEYPTDPENPNQFKTQLILADPSTDVSGSSKKDLEPLVIATQIQAMVGHDLVTDKGTGCLRPMEYGDIVILLRSVSATATRYVEILTGQGIPVISTTGKGYFSAVEVETVLNLLRIVDNPRQDIPLAAVLASPMVGLTSQELAELRIFQKEGRLYPCLEAYTEQRKEGETAEKLTHFRELLALLRRKSQDTSIHELIRFALKETGYLSYVTALPGGAARRMNLEMLVEKAVAFEKSSYQGLVDFIRYINQLEKFNVDFPVAGEESTNVVRLMTIHKSKGLEFPVVFVSGLGKRFNKKNIQSKILLHSEYGIGLKYTDLAYRYTEPTLNYGIIQRSLATEEAGEEQRVLYVALTRAKERLILTGTLNKAAEVLEQAKLSYGELGLRLGYQKRLDAGTYLDWIVPALVKKGSYSILIAIPGERQERALLEKMELDGRRLSMVEKAQEVSEEQYRNLEKQLAFVYPHMAEVTLRPKLSVSELKHRAMELLDPEEGSTLFRKEEVVPYLPAFVSRETKTENIGALRGTILHGVLERLDFTGAFSEVEVQLNELETEGKLTREERELLPQDGLKNFFESSLAQRMQQAARRGELFREKPFVMGKEDREINGPAGSKEMVLIQGIIDVFFREEDELVLVDYKTDRVKTPEELANRYRAQMELYGEALEKAMGLPVKEKILYSFSLGKEILL